MSPLRYAGAVLLVLLLGLLAVQTGRLQRAETAIQAEKAARARDKAAAAVAAASAVMDARAEEQRRQAEIQETADVAKTQAAAARRDASDARGRHDRLQQYAADLAARCGSAGGDPAASAGSPPAAGAGLVLADLFSRADERAGQLAEYADQARIAGDACERAYDALTKE